MRLLIYGGCHAGVFKKVFARYAAGEHTFDTLVNFQLIRTQTPFPYDRLGQYDAVLFSPILNQGDWNTSELEEVCKRIGVRTVKFPWLQWGGYWPKAKKRSWGRNAEWGLPILKALAAEEKSFDGFYRRLFESSQITNELQGWLAFTTDRLIAQEESAKVDIRISSWILDHYDKQQLFLTPDHPSTTLYKYVVRQAADALGLSIDPAFYASSFELQEGVRTPILPAVQSALNLAFTSPEWAHHDFLGDGTFGLREFALSYFDPSNVRLAQATTKTVLKLRPVAHSTEDRTGRTAVAKNSRILLQLLDEKPIASHRRIRIVNPLSSDPEPADQYIFASHWDLVAPAF